jgi:hypothetical protein
MSHVTSISQAPQLQDTPIKKMRVFGGVFLVISALAISSLGLNLHAHASAGCIASCASLGAASLVLGLYLIVAAKKKGVDAFDSQKSLRKEKILKAVMWGAFAFSLIFGANLGAAFIEKGGVGCLATCGALTSATFVLGVCLAYERSRKFNQVERVKVEISAMATQQPIQLENTIYFDAAGNRIRPTGITIPGTLTLDAVRKLVAANRALDAVEFMSEESFEQVVGDDLYYEGMWQTYKKDWLENLEKYNKPDYQHLLKDKPGLHDQPRGFHFREDAIEMVDQVTVGNKYAVRRRIVNTQTNEMTTEFSPLHDKPLSSITSYFERRDSLQKK